MTIVYCHLLSNCLCDEHLLALYVVKLYGYGSYRLICRKGQAISGIKSTEMHVRLNAVRVTIAVSHGQNAEKLLFLACNIRLITDTD